jgi:hypothetical protein
MLSPGMWRRVPLVGTNVITVNVLPSSLILSTLMMEAKRSFETSVPTKALWHHIPGDGILLDILSADNNSFLFSNFIDHVSVPYANTLFKH